MIRLALGLVVLLVLGIAAVIAVPRVVSQDQLDALIDAQLERTLAMRLVARGRLEPTLWPRPRLTLTDVALAGAGDELRAQRAVVEIGWLNLLAGASDGPTLRLSAFEATLRSTGLAGAVRAPARIIADNGTVRVDQLAPFIVTELEAIIGERDAVLRGEGTWSEQALSVDATLALASERAARVRSLDATLGPDQLGFVGRLDASGADGRLELSAVDLSSLRAQLPALPLPPLLDTIIAGHRGPVALSADLRADEAGWRLDDLEARVGATRLDGSLIVADDGIEATLRGSALERPEAMLEGALRVIRTAPDLLHDVARIDVETDSLRVRAVRAGEGLETNLRLALDAGTSLTADGQTDTRRARFDGRVTLVSENLEAVLPAGMAPPWDGPWPLTLAADTIAEPGRVELRGAQLTAPQLAFRGDLTYAPGAAPALALDGTLDRLQLPAALAEADGRNEALERLWQAADAGGAVVDLNVRRLELGDGESGAGRVVAELDRNGLWLTAFELNGRDLALSLTGGVHRADARIDAIGAAELAAPARLLQRAWPTVPLRPRGLGAGRLNVTLEGPLTTASLGVDGSLGDVDVRLSGTADLLADRWLDGQLDVAHPATDALLTALGLSSVGVDRLHGPFRLSLRRPVAGDPVTLAGEVQASALAADFSLDDGRLEVHGLSGPLAELEALAGALRLWPDDLERWRHRRQGDWPETGPLADGWPPSLAVSVADARLTAPAGDPATLDLALTIDAHEIKVDELVWRSPDQRYVARGQAFRGARGVVVNAELTMADDLDASIVRALGLGWLGTGRMEAQMQLALRGSTLRELAATVAGEARVEITSDRRAIRVRGGELVQLPALVIRGPLTFEGARADLGALRVENGALDGIVDLYAGRLAATLAVPANQIETATTVSITGSFANPAWRRAADVLPRATQ